MSISDELLVLVPILERAQQLGFLGREPVDNHIEHAQRYCVPEVSGARVAMDLGSGGGIPGLVLALLYPTATWKLVDAMAKRCAFLREAIEELRVDSYVSVVEGRAEDLGRLPQFRSRFDVVIARSFGPPAVVAECASPFLCVGGNLIVSEPPGSLDRWPSVELNELGLVKQSPAGGYLAVLSQFRLCGDRYPRRVGVPSKRPLF